MAGIIARRAVLNALLAVCSLGLLWLGGLALLTDTASGMGFPRPGGFVFMWVLSIPLALLAVGVQLLLFALLWRAQWIPSNHVFLRLLSSALFIAGFFAGQPARELIDNRFGALSLGLAFLVYGALHRIPVSRPSS